MCRESKFFSIQRYGIPNNTLPRCFSSKEFVEFLPGCELGMGRLRLQRQVYLDSQQT